MEKQPTNEPLTNNESLTEGLGKALKDMYTSLCEAGKEITEVVPQNRNFTIELQENDKGYRIYLKHKESGQEKDLNVFIPEQHVFVKNEKFIYQRREKEIGFPENQVQFRGFLLGLFHEIGHTHETQDYSLTKWETLRALWEGVSKLIKSIRITKEEKNEENSYKITSLPAKALLPNWYLDKKSESDAKSERDAWAYSLNVLRKLKQDGYDVFAGFDNVAQIREYVAHCLYTYDTELFMRKLMSGDLAGLEKLSEKPLFWKGSKNRNRIVISKDNSEN